MLRLTVWLLVGAFVSCDITCPDGSTCSDLSTCCDTEYGYTCCHYPNAVCCSDMAHCCPHGFRCNQAAHQCERVDPWMNMLKTGLAPEPSDPGLPVSRPEELKKTPMAALTEAGSSSLEGGVIRCDSTGTFYCPQATSCCKGSEGQWVCCPYRLGQCCADGRHCCEYGSTCDPSSSSCTGFYTEITAQTHAHAQTD